MKITILIVDDNQANLDTLNFLIKDIEFEHDVQVDVLEATNGNDALSLAISHKLALIILDIQMPEMDGFEVAKFLKKSSKTKDIPIAFLTAAYKTQDMREYGLHIGAFDYFLKPIDPLILVPKIKLYVNFYAVTQELKNSNLILEDKIKEAVEQNRQMEQKLYNADKLSSMGEMIGNIAHQWRQPLSIISTASTGIKMQQEFGLLDEKSLVDSMDNINNTVQYLSKTIDDFRNFIKGDNGIKIEFDLSEDIKKCLEIENSIIKQNNINIVLNLEDGIIVNSFPNGLIQAIINIINNAKDALKDKLYTKYIFIETTKINNEAIITIKDNAGGIPDTIMTKIFEPYFTTKHQSQGTGLGLHMTYQIIKDGMDGDIAVDNVEYSYENEYYKGAYFKITLPIFQKNFKDG
ncbi:MAG: hybrid sensor histidine kinase/response regulator [Campylobacterota bacterium]|nr:hybrid sensor histidine kinase/response regulator [Campylobacterota bacterium]